MQLAEVSIRRPVFATVLSLLLLLVGAVSFTRLQVREYPRIDEPVVTVNTTLVGASAEVIETQVTKPLEDSIAGIDGVDIITSISRQEQSQISVRFKLSKSPEDGAADVRDRVSRVRGRLARYGRRAHHLQGGGRRHADDLAGIHQRLAFAAGDQRPRQPHRQAPPANRVRRGRCEDQRRTQVLHAHLAGPGQAGRLPAHHAGCRGCLAQAEPRGSRRAHRRPAARIQRHGPDRPEHRAAVCRGVAQAGAGLHRQAQGRGAHRAGGAGGALERAPERGAFGVAGCHPPGHRKSAGGLRRRARDHAAHRGGSARRREGAGCQ